MEKRYKQTYDLDIDRYITKKMNSADKATFENIMATDASLKEEIAFREGLIKAMKWKRQVNIAHAEMLKKKAEDPLVVASKSDNQTVNTPIRRIGFRKVLAYAASLSLLVLAGSSWFANNNYSDQRLADGYTSGLLSIENSNLKGGDSSSKDPFEQGLYYLKEKEYVEAASFFKKIPQENETYTQARLHLAYSQYYMDAFVDAIQNSNIVIKESFDTKDKQKSEWLIVQSLLKQGKKDTKFFQQLQAIADNPNHIYQKRAKTLQSELNIFWRKLIF